MKILLDVRLLNLSQNLEAILLTIYALSDLRFAAYLFKVV